MAHAFPRGRPEARSTQSISDRLRELTSDSFLGVVLVTKSDSAISPASSDNLPSQPLLGDLFALLSAAMYAVYVILMKVAIGDEERADMRLLLG